MTTPGLAQSENEDIRPKRNSPYSRFGLGDPINQYFVASAGMGGLSAAFNDPSHINLRNPASLAFMQVTAFELGFNARYASMKGDDNDAKTWSGNLDYMALGFPLQNPINEALERQTRSPFGWGMAFSLQPYTVIGYDVEALTEGPDLGNTRSSFKGTGGTYRVLWGNAARWKNFSFGLNLAYLFGKLTDNRRVFFQDFAVSYDTEILDEISINGFTYEAGVQYVHHFMEVSDQGQQRRSGKRMVFGAYGHTPNSFKTNASKFVSRENGFETDTITFEEDIRQNGKLPTEFALGVHYEEINRLRLGVEYSLGQWSQYENEAKPDQLSNSWGVTFGAEYIPDIGSYNNYFEKIRYRLGGFYRQDPRSFQGAQLDGYALTLGLGFPLIRPRQTTSFINFSLEVGQFGSSEIIRETYVRMALGFTLNDNTWFFKRKFN